MYTKPLILIFGLAIAGCLSSKRSQMFYQNDDTKLLSKNNGLHKKLKHLIYVERRQTYQLHPSYDLDNFKNWEAVPDSTYWFSLGPVSNKDYRKFTDYVRDSIARMIKGYIYTPFKGPHEFIDWSKKLDWDDEDFLNQLDVITTPYPERKSQGITVRYEKINYNFYGWNEWPRSTHTSIYPDTLSYQHLNSAHWNTSYFNDTSFNNEAVYGISRLQATAYCHWLSAIWNNTLARNGKSERVEISFPPEGDLVFIKRLITSEKYADLIKKNYSSKLNTDSGSLKIFLRNDIDSVIEKCDTQLWYIVRLLDHH